MSEKRTKADKGQREADRLGEEVLPDVHHRIRGKARKNFSQAAVRIVYQEATDNKRTRFVRMLPSGLLTASASQMAEFSTRSIIHPLK